MAESRCKWLVWDRGAVEGIYIQKESRKENPWSKVDARSICKMKAGRQRNKYVIKRRYGSLKTS